jgi:syntaxin 1B/2/3
MHSHAHTHTHTQTPQDDINAVSKSADAIKKRLAELDRGNEAALKRKGCGPGSSSERTRTAITGALKKKLKDLMGEFQDLRWVLRAGVVGAACLVADGLVAGAVGA